MRRHQFFRMSAFPTKRALGIKFFDGTVDEAVDYISKNGGLVVAPAAPSFIALQDDPEYRRAIADADLAIADSGWMVNFWWLLRRERLARISGLRFFLSTCSNGPIAAKRASYFGFCQASRRKRKRSNGRDAKGFP